MKWAKPDFQEISLGMEVTAYVNTDEQKTPKEETKRTEPSPSASSEPREQPR